MRIHPDHLRHPGIEGVAIKEVEIGQSNHDLILGEAWETEANVLQVINELHNGHILDSIAAIRRGNNRYFMFPWANGGSLRHFWDSAPGQNFGPDIIRDAIHQLRGLVDALDHLHNFGGSRSDRVHRTGGGGTGALPSIVVLDEYPDPSHYTNATHSQFIRHGNLKPENILRFSQHSSHLGLLKMADMGLAPRHIVVTGQGRVADSTGYGTVRYEPPEVVTETQARSRPYDIWSMGCIILEFIIWMLYGKDELNNFYDQVRGDGHSACQYFEIVDIQDGGSKAEVHHEVRRWIDHMRSSDPEFSQESAMGDLLEIVWSKLLVVALPQRHGYSPKTMEPFGVTPIRYRATAREFRDALDDILAKMSNPGYLVTGKAREEVRPPSKPDAPPLPLHSQRPTQAASLGGLSASKSPAIMQGGTDYSLLTLRDWEFPVDNDFAGTVLSEIGSRPFYPESITPSSLCGRCEDLDFWAPGFSFSDNISTFREKSQECQFCRMLYRLCEKTKTHEVNLVRNQSHLVLSGVFMPVMSILRSPGKFIICCRSVDVCNSIGDVTFSTSKKGHNLASPVITRTYT